MKVECSNCNTVYNLPKPPSRRVMATCKKCGSQFVIDPMNIEPELQMEPILEEPKQTSEQQQSISQQIRAQRGIEDDRKWYYSGWFILLLFIFFYPVALVLMWRQKPRGKVFGNTFVRVVVTLFFGLVTLGAFVGGDYKASQENVSSANATVEKRGLTTEVASEKRTTVPLPPSQKSFIEVLSSFQGEYSAAPNELKKSAVRNKRRNQIRKVLNGKVRISKWVGTLQDMGTTSERKAYISIRLEGSKYEVKTWNNAVSDIMDDTLIEPESSLYKKIAELSEGDKVIFSGSFITGKDDFIREGSMTESGAMLDPEFIVKISDIRKI